MSRPPTPCDTDIYKNGEIIMMTAEIEPNKLDAWVHKVAKLSEQPVDWRFVGGGQALIRALGDTEKVKRACLELIGEHNKLQEEKHYREHPELGDWTGPRYKIYWHPTFDISYIPRLLVENLMVGVSKWAADEDGIHPDAFEPYRELMEYIRQPCKWDEDNQEWVCPKMTKMEEEPK